MSEKIKHVCSERVCRARQFDNSPCLYNATVFEDGKWWCKRHSPSVRKAKSDERVTKFYAKLAADKLKYDRSAVIAKLTENLPTEILARSEVRDALVNVVTFYENEVKK